MLNFKLLTLNLKSTIKLTIIIVATFAATMLLSYIFSLIQINLNDIGPHPRHFIRGGFFRDSVIAIIVLFSTQLMYLSNKQQKTALENKTLLSENIRTRYEALKNQVDPHFLFNSLNTLNSLIKTDADKAQEYVQQLSFVFRYTLQNKEIIGLKEELNFTEAYCKLMQIRYGESLKFHVDIDKKYNDYLIMPLSLQTLVENAIKHNIVSNKQPLSIDIIGREEGFVTVSNPIHPKKESEKGEGIGLINLAERYRLMTQKEIIIQSSEGIFSVKVPVIKPD
jgi:LytS/YehU family sensor histidine kinase